MKVLLVPSGNPETVKSARYLASRLVIAGIDAQVQPPDNTSEPVAPLEEVALVVPMGGDGTFLSAVHLVDFAPVPLLGLNYGTLAFLAGDPARDEVELVTDALAGDILFERRGTIDATVTDADGSRYEFTALNELVYARGASGHVVEYTYGINGTRIAHLKADGLVVSTATGSTAYALSAGGPIVSPRYKGMVIVPVAPHALNTRAVVTSPSDVLEALIRSAGPRETSLFVDGVATGVSDPVRLEVRRGAREVLFALGGGDFFTNVSRVFFGGPYPPMDEE